MTLPSRFEPTTTTRTATARGLACSVQDRRACEGPDVFAGP